MGLGKLFLFGLKERIEAMIGYNCLIAIGYTYLLARRQGRAPTLNTELVGYARASSLAAYQSQLSIGPTLCEDPRAFCQLLIELPASLAANYTTTPPHGDIGSGSAFISGVGAMLLLGDLVHLMLLTISNIGVPGDQRAQFRVALCTAMNHLGPQVAALREQLSEYVAEQLVQKLSISICGGLPPAGAAAGRSAARSGRAGTGARAR